MLAFYLTNTDSQLKRYGTRGLIPTNQKAIEGEINGKKWDVSDEELKNLIARRNAIIYAKPIVRRNAFSYFWPFLVLSFAAYQAAQQAIMVFGPALPWGQFLDSYYMYYLIPGMAFALIHIFGGIYARKKRDEQNRKANEDEVARNIEDARLRERISELQYKKNQCLK